MSMSTVNVHLRLNYDPLKAMTEISAKVNQVRGDLPPRRKFPPIVIEAADSQFASAYLSFSSTILDQNQITDYLTRSVQPRLTAIAGVQKKPMSWVAACLPCVFGLKRPISRLKYYPQRGTPGPRRQYYKRPLALHGGLRK